MSRILKTGTVSISDTKIASMAVNSCRFSGDKMFVNDTIILTVIAVFTHRNTKILMYMDN